MDFRPLNTLERSKLLAALRSNVKDECTILVDGKDTSFAGVSTLEPGDEASDAEVVNAIRSVPQHYAC